MEEKDLNAISRVREEIEKIEKKENTIYFFVLDTKGNPSGTLEYIYRLAKIVADGGYNVGMLYQKEKDDEFEGVESWLGEEFASLPHYDIANSEVKVASSDILFIPEIFANVMNQTKKLPCKRIALVQNFDYLLEQMPMSAQWGDFGILDAITNTDTTASYVKDIFPYVKATTIPPYIDKMYGSTDEPKKMIINIIAEDQQDINKVIKPFYWKYPMYKWVSFRDLRGFPKEQYAQYLREAAVTVWLDRNSSFGYGALEAMKSGSIVIAQMTDTPLDWAIKDGDNMSNCCVWFNNFHEVQRIIASVVRAWITNAVPTDIDADVQEAVKPYTYKNTKEIMLKYIDGVCANRKTTMENLIKEIESK